MDIRHLAAIRLASPPPVAGPPAPEIAARLDRAETDFLRVPPPRDRLTWRRGPVTLGVLGVLLAVFALEVAQGGSEDNAVLFRMGGLWPPAVLRNGEWWRLAAAPFLHAGPVHLGFNLVALLFLGFAAETMFGRVRFLVLYGLTALGSTAGVLALMHFGWTAPGLLIGASGALMGLAGAIAAALVVRPRGEPEAGGGRQFWGIVLLLAVQSGMDLTTPHVSFSAHASGFVLGFLLGLLPAFRRGARLPALPAPRPSPAAAGPTGRPMGGPVGGRPVGGRRTLGIYVVIGLVFGTALWSRIRKSPLSGARPAPRPTPALTPAVLAGIRRLHFLFFDGEAGTPLVDPEAPFGSRDALADLADLAGRDGDARALYAAIMANLPAFCARARLTPGRYALTPARVAAINATLPRDVPPAARDGMFVFTREHAVLIPVLRWQTMDGDFSWDMAIDQGHLPPSPGNAWPVALVTPKRPYGDFTFFEADMARALGIPHGKNARGEAELPKALIDRLYRLHGEMTAAVQVFVQRATVH